MKPTRKPQLQPAKSRPTLETLEPRIMYSAELAPAAFTPAADDVGHGETRVLDAAGEFSVEATGAQDVTVRRELVLVESNTPDYQRLIDQIAGQGDAQRELEIVVLDANRDGISLGEGAGKIVAIFHLR